MKHRDDGCITFTKLTEYITYLYVIAKVQTTKYVSLSNILLKRNYPTNPQILTVLLASLYLVI